jgi:hypothetical protein
MTGLFFGKTTLIVRKKRNQEEGEGKAFMHEPVVQIPRSSGRVLIGKWDCETRAAMHPFFGDTPYSSERYLSAQRKERTLGLRFRASSLTKAHVGGAGCRS